MKVKQKKPNTIINNILKSILYKYFRLQYNIEYDNHIDNIKPPYIILSNHVNFWDPFFIAVDIKEHVYFVASDEYFRNIITKPFLRLFRAIPKTKFFSDMQTIKDIMRIKNNNGIIGIFPEGSRSWDGESEEILYPTAKLISKLNIPVIIASIKGGYLSYPRWAMNPRKGKVFISYKCIIDKEQIPKISHAEIYEILKSELKYDEYEFQLNNMISFIGKKLAEKLELLLFICPHCKAISSMKSNDNNFYCMNCNYLCTYNEFGFLENKDSNLYFNNVRDWNKWQLQYINEYIISLPSDNNPIITDSKVVVLIGKRLRGLKKYRIGTIELFKNFLRFTNIIGEKICFDIPKIQGLNVQYNNKFEFYHENTLYRFVFKDKSISAYKWVEIIKFLKGVN